MKHFGRSLFLAAFAIILFSCESRFRVDCDPPDARITVNGLECSPGQTLSLRARSVSIEARRRGYRPASLARRSSRIFGVERIGIQLERESYEIEISAIPASAALGIDGAPPATLAYSGKLAYGRHRIAAAAAGFPAQSWDFEVTGPGTYRFRLQSEPTGAARPLGIFRCGRAPKQVTFSPDGGRLFVPLLSGGGFDVIDIEERKAARVSVPGYEADQGFVEGIFPAGKESFLVSQMTRDAIHEYELPREGPPRYLRSMSSRGTWTKVLAYEPRAGRLAASNWVSSDVTVLDYGTGRLLKRLAGLSTPRGLAWSPDGSLLYVASFGGAGLFRFETAGWKQTGRLPRPGSALRHLALDRAGRTLFASDMERAEALEVDAATMVIRRVFKTGSNPNTLALSPDERFLAVSCRGPNSDKGYIARSPAPGEVLVFDLASGKRVAAINGGAQPTGLDISRDGRLLAFTNFQDANVELYDISALGAAP
jgi:DNA-binding beta-propeller fold protein YncE